MQAPQLISPIRILPAQLADQIAAGEVIERPASVLKELIENSLDAGCQRLDIELLHGGLESLRVSDDGYGIDRDELPLAISRHATSKISQLDDLINLQSLGFRGEALASICSVSQWEISSRRQTANEAFSLRHDRGRKLMSVNHTTGTSVLIRNLFFNTPARRKFLRSERTEFRHCDEVVRRMALARFDVAFYLRHNGRQVHRLPAVEDDIGRSRRVSQLCGEAFARNSLVIHYPRNDMSLWGWISKPEYSRQQNDLQYFYINGRIIRDRVINHALRAAYQAYLPPGRQAAYVLHLELDPATVDVNVHPTKHEVRFREARRIHDFLIRCVRDSLLQQPGVQTDDSDSGVRDMPANYSFQNETVTSPSMAQRDESFFGSVQCILMDRFVVTRSALACYLVDVKRAHAGISCRRWQQALQNDEIKSRPVLIPRTLELSVQQMQAYEQRSQLLSRLGYDITQSGPTRLLLRALPVWLQGFDGARVLIELLERELSESSVFTVIESCLNNQLLDLSHIDVKLLLSWLSQQGAEFTACWREITQNDLSAWLLEQQTQS